jgi:uncharacterized protein DUF1302
MKHKILKKLLFVSIVLGVCLSLSPPASAIDVEVAGNRLNIQGFINQGAAFGITGDHFDTQQGLQQAVFDMLVEARYEPLNDFMLYASGQLTGDFAYAINDSDDDWENRQFDQSDDRIEWDTDLFDLLQEFHVTWAPGDFLFRIGKQVTVWGETDGLRLMDQINPVDKRRGPGDVEFESTILPIWLLRAEYGRSLAYDWIQELGVQVIFNPNADFQPNRDFVTGNDRAGIWAVDQNTPFPGIKLGSFITSREEPDEWDPDTWEVGVRLRAIMYDAIVTLNYFYGIDNDPTLFWQRDPMAPPPGTPGFPPAGVPWISPPVLFGAPPEIVDGVGVIHPHMIETFNRFRFTGVTFTKDILSLTAPGAIGGVAPVLRLEALYLFDYTVYDEGDAVLTDEVDELRYVVGVDWKIKLNWLNPRALFFISGQFFHRHIFDYPDFQIRLLHEGGRVDQNNYATTLLINTRYLHEKLTPSIFWYSDWTKDCEMLKFQLNYEPTSAWQYTVGALFFSGQEDNELFEAFANKDQVYLTVGYRF